MEDFTLVVEELEKRRTGALKKSEDRALCSLSKLLSAMDLKGIRPADFDSEMKQIKNALGAQLDIRALHKANSAIKQKLRHEHKIITPGYYQKLWMVLGMTAFGLPFGFMMATALDNFAFFSLGLPIGMPIGMALGIGLDKKAKEEGRVLDYGENARSFV